MPPIPERTNYWTDSVVEQHLEEWMKEDALGRKITWTGVAYVSYAFTTKPLKIKIKLPVIRTKLQ